MNAYRFALAAALLSAGNAHAQLRDPEAQAQLQARPSLDAKVFPKAPTLGVAHSERRGADAMGKSGNVDNGLYTALGAQYRLNEKAAVSVESQSFGNTKKWGADSNGNGVNARLKLGF